MFETLFAIGFGFTIIGGAVLGIIAFFRTRDQVVVIQRLERQLAEIRGRLSQMAVQLAENAEQRSQSSPPATPTASEEATAEKAVPGSAARVVPVSPAELEQKTNTSDNNVPSPAVPPVDNTPREPGPIEIFFTHVSQNWMAWLGGVSLGLAGVFLAIYSIEAGLLGPTARIVVGILLGLTLQASAEYLRRREGRTNTVFAALAAGGSITLFAAILAALHLYQLVSQPVAFVGLALVAGTTMALALLHGPLLAALGLLGAYVVPALMGSAGGDRKIVLTYALIVSGGALMLMRYIYRPWLWQGMLVGALGWWLLTLDAASADGARGLYLSLFAYLVLALPALDFLLRQRETLATVSYNPLTRWQSLDRQGRDYLFCLALVALAQMASVYTERYSAMALLSFTPLLVLSLVIANKRESLKFMPWLLTVGQVVVWLLAYVSENQDQLQILTVAPAQWDGFLIYAMVTAAVTTGGALYNFGQARSAAVQDGTAPRFVALSASLAVLAPLFWLICAYMLTG